MNQQKNCRETLLQISWLLAKYMKPFIDAEIVNECMLQFSKLLFGNK